MNRWMKGIVSLAVGVGLIVGVTGAISADQPGPRGTGQATMGMAMRWAGLPDAVEKLLNLTHDQIEAARAEGQSLVQIAAGAGVSEEALVKAIVDERVKAVDAAQQAGTITEAQAANMKARIAEQVAAMVQRTETGPMQGEWRDADPSGLGAGQKWQRSGARMGGNVQGRGANGVCIGQ